MSRRAACLSEQTGRNCCLSRSRLPNSAPTLDSRDRRLPACERRRSGLGAAPVRPLARSLVSLRPAKTHLEPPDGAGSRCVRSGRAPSSIWRPRNETLDGSGRSRAGNTRALHKKLTNALETRVEPIVRWPKAPGRKAHKNILAASSSEQIYLPQSPLASGEQSFIWEAIHQSGSSL